MIHHLSKTLYKFLKPFGYVLLSNGFLIKVRRLALYELDNVPYNDPGPFVYEYVNQVSGRVMKRTYDVGQWAEPPKPPKTPEHECAADSMEAALWHVYNTYQAALLQQQKQAEAAEQYANDVARYILDTCISRRANRWITTPVDFVTVYNAALTPEVTQGDIERIMRDKFRGLFQGWQHFRADEILAKGQSQAKDSAAVGRANYESVEYGC